LGVRFTVNGSVRRSGERLRISAELVDTELSRALWADRFERSVSDIFAVQDELAHQIATFIFNTVAPMHLVKLYRTPSLEAYELVVKSRMVNDRSLSTNRQAEASYRRAIDLDPNYPEAHWKLSNTQIHWWCQFGGERNLAQKEALSLAQRAFELDGNDSGVYTTMGMTLTKHGRHEEALDWYQRGLAVDPASGDCYAGIGEQGLLSGNAEQALTAFTTAIGLSPFPPWWHFDHLGRAQLFAGDVENALTTLTRPDIVREFSGSFVAAAYAAAGLEKESHRTATEFQTFQPHWRIERWIANEFFHNDATANFWRQAFMKAGLPK
jgi:adenylate cyclase